MQVSIFGKTNCGKCLSTKKMLGHFIPKWGLTDTVSVEFYDMETTDGMAEGAFYDVSTNLPTVIIAAGEKTLARWEGHIPNTDELKMALAGARA